MAHNEFSVPSLSPKRQKLVLFRVSFHIGSVSVFWSISRACGTHVEIINEQELCLQKTKFVEVVAQVDPQFSLKRWTVNCLQDNSQSLSHSDP